MIPKISSLSEPSECRNISCTALLSKVYEGFVLKWAKESIKLNENQYGGMAGCSTSHLLINLVDEVTSTLEDRHAACVLTGVDYSKAFNRLAHGPCLK